MEWNLLPILNCEGKRMTVDTELTLCLRPEDDFSVLAPVPVRGEIVNIGGCLELNAKGAAKVTLICDRCAEPFETEIPFEIAERLKKEDANGEEENPDITVLQGNSIDLSELAYDALVLSIPTKVLCKEDCKGLCVRCGQNLNLAECACDTRQTDPRFDVLDQLL